MGPKLISTPSFCDDFTPVEEIIHDLLINGADEDLILQHLDDYKTSLMTPDSTSAAAAAAAASTARNISVALVLVVPPTPPPTTSSSGDGGMPRFAEAASFAAEAIEDAEMAFAAFAKKQDFRGKTTLVNAVRGNYLRVVQRFLVRQTTMPTIVGISL